MRRDDSPRPTGDERIPRFIWQVRTPAPPHSTIRLIQFGRDPKWTLVSRNQNGVSSDANGVSTDNTASTKYRGYSGLEQPNMNLPVAEHDVPPVVYAIRTTDLDTASRHIGRNDYHSVLPITTTIPPAKGPSTVVQEAHVSVPRCRCRPA